LEVNGSINIRGGGSLYVGGTLLADLNRDIYARDIGCRNFTPTGIYPKETGGFVNLSVAFPASLSNLFVVLPSGCTTIREFICVASLSGADGTANIELRNNVGTLLNTITVVSNGIGQLTASILNATAAGFVEVRLVPGSATVGTFTLNSYSISAI
jgi:hypothetical protein